MAQTIVQFVIMILARVFYCAEIEYQGTLVLVGQIVDQGAARIHIHGVSLGLNNDV